MMTLTKGDLDFLAVVHLLAVHEGAPHCTFRMTTGEGGYLHAQVRQWNADTSQYDDLFTLRTSGSVAELWDADEELWLQAIPLTKPKWRNALDDWEDRPPIAQWMINYYDHAREKAGEVVDNVMKSISKEATSG